MWIRSALLLALVSSASIIAVGQGGRGIPKGAHPHISLGTALSGPTIVHGAGTVTPSGLKYWDLRSGTGSQVVKGKAVKIAYTAWLDSGKKFESSAELGEPLIFVLGAGQVIKGLDEGIEGLRVGSKRQLRIPADLAFGAMGSQLVPPNSAVIYDVEVLGAQ